GSAPRRPQPDPLGDELVTTTRRAAAALVLVLALVAGVAPLVEVGPLAAAPAAAATTPTYGGPAIAELRAAADHFARPDCGLNRHRLGAMMIAPTFTETGAPTSAAPGPMTLSRWDTQPALWAFGD